MVMTSFIECRPDRANPSIHHVGWRDYVTTGICLNDCLFTQNLDGLIVQNITIHQQTIMPVIGKRVEGNITDDPQIRMRGLHRTHRTAHKVFRIGCQTAIGGL